MAANRFATMVHRNSNKITLILIYAVLEWVLIVLLLLNSLFSYLIVKFAEYFGLTPPCPWCAKIDRLFDSSGAGKKNLHRDNLCEVHAREVSGLGFCSNHRRLVESKDMCVDCSGLRESSKDSAILKGFREEMVGGESGEVSLNHCSCCGVSLVNNEYSPYALLRTSSWDILECGHKENLINESVLCDENEISLENRDKSEMISGFDVNLEVKEKGTEENCSDSANLNVLEDVLITEEEEKVTLLEERLNLVMVDKSVQVSFVEDSLPETSLPHLEFFLDYSGHKLVPIELVDSMTEENKSCENTEFGDDDKNKDQEFGPDSEAQVEETEEVVEEGEGRTEKLNSFLDIDINEEPKYEMEMLESMELEEDENSLVFHAKEFRMVMMPECEDSGVFLQARWSSEETNDVQLQGLTTEDSHLNTDVAYEEVSQVYNEPEADVSIGTEIPDLDITVEIQIKESIQSNECSCEDPLAGSADLPEAEDSGPIQADEHMVELQPLSIRETYQEMENRASLNQLDSNENEDDKVPDTPTSGDSFNHLHKKLLMLEKRDSGTEESLDGSITSELEGADGATTVERLKSALRAERKALHVLYTELEEERSASAVAANQTMAMINRLQEEKAAMQMEALQYQRMMEEQSEYDQEALQLLNELMMKREREKQELEKELDACRKKLLDYETRERVRILKRSKDGSMRSGFSSGSCSNTEDSDELSIDLNQEVKEDAGFYRDQEDTNPADTPIDAVVNLEESLADFEEERMSILQQLKVLEEKLSTLDDDNDQHFEDVREMDNNLHFENADFEVNGHANGFSEETVNGKNHQLRKIAVQMGKSLLPLFDATNDENGEVILNGNGTGMDAACNESGLEMPNANGHGIISNGGAHDSHDSSSDNENKKHAIEEEVDHLYERLQALEADREFLKHCIRSLKKGDKGTDLLQEILQHLRDLRSVELRVRHIAE